MPTRSLSSRGPFPQRREPFGFKATQFRILNFTDLRMVDGAKERRVGLRKLDIGAAERAKAGDRIRPGGFYAFIHCGPAPPKTIFRKRPKEGRTVCKVAPRSPVGNIEVPREPAQTQCFNAGGRDDLRRPHKQ